jgi:mannose-6-phosphate isomerase-like protein (cupin superfamily)
MTDSISVQTAEHNVWGGICDGWHLVRSADLSVIQERVPLGGRDTRALHSRSRQFFFVLDGEAVPEVWGQRHLLRARAGLEVAPGSPHQLINASAQAVTFLVISQPPSHGDRLPAESKAA